ncbi:hypothetical protein AXG93_626s1170 [Marchantia polymorpha subsp. ruderalis]|uniref:Uncharacterized protein n=1 Tax=Marchantia polymorpha subsp. ruderalis TaxID=1480154 RepID=A0A176W1G5_MARPO|nr:hypothetical protein AXG93_626s1170 [Marchantia polymorpha subsp. ruderalis]
MHWAGILSGVLLSNLILSPVLSQSTVASPEGVKVSGRFTKFDALTKFTNLLGYLRHDLQASVVMHEHLPYSSS